MNGDSKLINSARSMLEKGDFQGALSWCQKQNQSYPSDVAAWQLAAHIFQRAGKPDKAVTVLLESLRAAGQKVSLLVSLCEAFVANKQKSQALVLVRELVQSLALRPIENVEIYGRLAYFLTSLELHPESLPIYRRIVALQPGVASHHYNLASCLRFLGLLDDAENELNQALVLEPLDTEAQLLRSGLRKQLSNSNHITELTALAATPSLSYSSQVNLAFALAKELEDLEDYAQSFQVLQAGAELKRKNINYRIETDLDIMKKIAEVFHHDLFDGKIPGSETKEPIFVIGMPRTGTTLVERILASHSDVYAAGELHNFSSELIRLAKIPGVKSSDSRLSFIENTAHVDFATLGRNYVDSTRPMTGSTAHFIDKLPFNYLYAGLIHLAFPNAKIISLTRNPIDTCFAVFKQLFRSGYPFSYSLDELADYYIAYRNLMAHWFEVMPGVIHEVSYENLVTNLEVEARAMVSYCQLPWQDKCLEFHLNSAATSTASAVQVREKLYSTSIGHGNRYETQLQGLKSRLEAGGVTVA
mgnify:CR=1 FL=1